MALTTPPPRRNVPGGDFPMPPRLPPLALALLGVAALVVLGVCYWWFVQRVEVGPGQVLVLVKKTGASLPGEAGTQVLLYPELLKELGEAPDSRRYKGILYEVLPEGRYFLDPFYYERRIVPALFIEQNEVAVLIRKYGEPLADGKIVATEPDERGPLAQVLQQGRHNINPYAYDHIKYPIVQIPAGHVGVQTLYSGRPPSNPNRYVVEDGERGVQPSVLPPGLERNNPFVRRIDVIDIRSHTIDLRGDEAVHFPSNDSFDIMIEGTVEYAIRQEQAPYVMVAMGDHEDIKNKLILPYMRSLARIEGSKLLARDFISGETRTAFQDRVFAGLREACAAQGIEIRSALIRRIEPPREIADPISDRQIAEQQIRQYEEEINVARSDALLVEQQEMQRQNEAVGQAKREVVTVVVGAEQGRAVALTEANKRLEVAKLELEAARETAAALTSRGEAEAQVVRLKFEAEARPLRDAVAAFGGGEQYAQYFYYQKLSPALKSVLASTDGPLADILRSLSTPPAAGPPRSLSAGALSQRGDEPQDVNGRDSLPGGSQ